jgi:hypothetical protein
MNMGLPLGPLCVPLGPVTENAEAIRGAVGRLVMGTMDPTETDVLAAWLSAFSHHFPSAFAEMLGEIGEASLRMLAPKIDRNRYLKLRRIALANLAKLL